MTEWQLITREHAIAAATHAARRVGYAIGVHGSRIRDLDLIAVPWTDEARTAKVLAEAIAAAIPGVIDKERVPRPHGRLGWTIRPRWVRPGDPWYVDLSVMPRRRAKTAPISRTGPPMEDR